MSTIEVIYLFEDALYILTVLIIFAGSNNNVKSEILHSALDSDI